MIIKNKKNIILIALLFLGFTNSPFFVFGAQGVIDSVNHSALLCMDDSCATTTRINFITTNGRQVEVTDSLIRGDVWSEQMGWINLDPTNSGVINDGNGNLSGYAWGENAGWINFNPSNSGVSIINGDFSGYAWSQNYGWIKFDCGVLNACVKTDWSKTINGGGGGTGSVGGTSGGDVVIPPVVNPPPVVIPPIVINPPDVTTIPPVVITTPPDVSPTLPEISVNEDFTNTDNTQDDSSNNLNGDGVNFLDFIIGDNGLGNVLIKTQQIIINSLPIISNVVETPIGRTVTQSVATTGAVVGSVFSFATVLFANPLSFSELFFIPLRLWGLLMTAFGIKKRNRPWGTVYDSVTKQPLDPVYVMLKDLQGNEIATSITDLDGRYGFLVPSGVYKIVANKTNYIFPSKKLVGKNADELYQDLYFNEIIEIKEGDVITKNIPMDPLKFDWNEFAKRDQKRMKFFSRRDIWISRISGILFWLGFVLSLLAVTITPSVYNVIIFVVYIILLILKNTIIKPRPFGTVSYSNNNLPLSFAVMRIFFAGSDHEVTHKVTDKNGKYYCLVPNGVYYVKIENKNIDETYSLVHTTGNIEVKNGYINSKIKIG